MSGRAQLIHTKHLGADKAPLTEPPKGNSEKWQKIGCTLLTKAVITKLHGRCSD